MNKMNNIPIIEKNNAEKYSSAISLSDMEIFIFPELLYSLVLSNIMLRLYGNGKKIHGFQKSIP